MTTEQKILKQILENKKKASVQFIGKQLKLGNAYISYLCQELSKKDLLKKLKIRDCYEITQKGWKELERIEGLEPISKKKRKRRIRKKRVKGKVTKIAPKKEIQVKAPKPEVSKAPKPSEKKIKKIIKVFKNLFSIKKKL